MTERKQEQGPHSFWQLGNPFLAMLLETDAPGHIFHPFRAMAIGQFQTMSLLNRRIQASAELPRRLAACRSPEDLMRENLRFIQGALRDWSDAVQAVADAWDEALHEQTATTRRAKHHHDYLALPGEAADNTDGKRAGDGKDGRNGKAARRVARGRSSTKGKTSTAEDAA